MNCKIGNWALALCIVGLLSLSAQLFSTYQTLEKYEAREARQEMLTKINAQINDIERGVSKINALQTTINCLLYENQKLRQRNSTISAGTTAHRSTTSDCNKYMNGV